MQHTQLEQLATRLSAIINERRATPLWDIQHRILKEQRASATTIINDWVSKGVLTQTGTGKKGSPILISNPQYIEAKEEPRCRKRIEGKRRRCQRFPGHIGECAVNVGKKKTKPNLSKPVARLTDEQWNEFKRKEDLRRSLIPQ